MSVAVDSTASECKHMRVPSGVVLLWFVFRHRTSGAHAIVVYEKEEKVLGWCVKLAWATQQI